MIQPEIGQRDFRVHRFAVLDQVGDARQVQRVVLGAPAGPGDRAQALDASAREFRDAAGPDPVVAEEGKRVPQALRQGRQRRIGRRRVLVQEFDPQAGRHPSLAMEREKRVVHRVGVLAGEAAGQLVRVKGAAVAMRGDAEPRVVLQGAERGPLPRLWRQQFLAQGQKGSGQRGPRDGAVGRDHHAARLEPRLSLAVRSRAALRRLDVDRAFDRIEFGQRRQAPLRELHGRDGADGRDELAGRNARRCVPSRRQWRREW